MSTEERNDGRGRFDDRGRSDDRTDSEDRSRGPRDSRDGGGFRRSRPYFRKKVCRFCTQGLKVNYRSPDSLRRFVTERGKILPRRITGNCAKHQRSLALEVKRARALALLPYSKK